MIKVIPGIIGAIGLMASIAVQSNGIKFNHVKLPTETINKEVIFNHVRLPNVKVNEAISFNHVKFPYGVTDKAIVFNHVKLPTNLFVKNDFNSNYKFEVDTGFAKKKKLMMAFRIIRFVTTGIGR